MEIQNAIVNLDGRLVASCKITIILFSYDLSLALLGVYPKELKTYVHTKICTGMFIPASFIVAKNAKKPRCPSVGEWINTVVQPDNGTLF